MEFFSVHRKLLILFIHHDIAAARHTAGSHTAGYYSRMAGHTAAYGQDTLGALHSLDILREVSRRTRTTFSPLAAHALASSAVNTILPQAAPGEAPRAFAIGTAAFRAAASN